MAVTITWFTKGIKNWTNVGKANLVPKMLLLDNTASIAGTEEFVADLSGETNGANYARKTLDNGVLNVSGSNVIYDGDNITFPTLGNGTHPLLIAVVFHQANNDTDSPVLFYINFGANTSPGGLDFPVRFNASGIITIGGS